MLKGFKDFISRGNAVDLAVGVVIGTAFNALIQSVVGDLLTPLISAFGGQPDFSSWAFSFRHTDLRIGSFLNVVIAFLINAVVIYFFIVLPFSRFRRLTEKKEEQTTKDCPYCLKEIPAGARRCPFCTSSLELKQADK